MYSEDSELKLAIVGPVGTDSQECVGIRILPASLIEIDQYHKDKYVD